MPVSDAEPLVILLVEDNYADARLFQIALQGCDASAELTVAADGEAAMELLRAHGNREDPGRPDLVVTDLNMPRRSGHELIAFLKAHPLLRSVPVVVFSGSKNPADVERSYEDGAASYVCKPGDPERFFDVVRSLVRYWSRIARSRRAIRTGLPGPALAEAPLLTQALDGTILTWSPLAQELYGYTADEVVGRSIRTLVPPEAEGELQQLLEALERGESVLAFHAVRVHKDGRRLEVSLSVSPLRDPAGEVIGAASQARELH
jgi:PAS domain S-box-containing protein